ncbi:MAG: FtsQ-type POTRA domain-containing protein [Polyangiaceae bacterium]|nr:FtsQ-type POTRA domain-containing protein [Polyangiaceae bacterium]
MNSRRRNRIRHGNYIAAPDERPERDASEAAATVEPDNAAFVTAPNGRFGRVVSGFKILVGVTSVLGLAVGIGWSVYRYAVNAPAFAITRIEVEGAVHLSDTKVAELAGIRSGQNLFRVDIDRAEQKLLGDPWIVQAKVRHQLPDGVRIDIAEREARAIAVIEERPYLVSPDGLPFKTIEPGDPHDLPFVTGVSLANLARDATRERERLSRALEVLRQYERIELSRIHPPQEVHLSPSGQVTLMVGKAGIALELGAGSWQKKLMMAARVIGRLQAQRRLPEIVFLDNQAHPERVVARLK